MPISCDKSSFLRSMLLISNFVEFICDPKEKIAQIDSIKNSGTVLFETELKRFKDGSLFKDKPTITFQGILINVTKENYKEYNEGVKTADKDLSMMQLMHKYGYKSETHYVTTSDGYILTLFRIPAINGTAVYLEHGVLSSSDDWITTGPNKSLAYLLADKGFDVWIGNARGNKHCQKHVRLTPKDEEFWNFSFDEIGRYDLPAVIDYVLNITKQKQLIYIGHSQGTTVFFIMCSERPEYNKKISYMIALAPVAWMYHTTSPVFRLLAPFGQDDHSILRRILGPSLSPNDTTAVLFKNVVCGGNVIQNLLCMNLFFATLGFDNSQVNFKALSTTLAHTPGGIASKQLEHYSQFILSGRFRRFDYRKRNTDFYGTANPPKYRVDKIRVPMALFQAEADWAADTKDIQTLMSNLRNKFSFHVVPYKSFTHTDFLFGKDVVKLVYNDIFKLLQHVS